MHFNFEVKQNGLFDIILSKMQTFGLNVFELVANAIDDATKL